MTDTLTRRTVLTGLAAVPALTVPAFAADQGQFTGDVVMGQETAKLEVIEYASFTCPHCAAFHINTWPKIKEAYVDTGKIKFILREVYFDQYGLWASMTARCGGPKGFYPMADTFLKTQSTWTRAPDIGSAIQQIGRRAGLSNGQITECLSNRDYAKVLLENYQANAGRDAVKSTPTFIIGGSLHTGNMTFESLSEIIEAKL